MYALYCGPVAFIYLINACSLVYTNVGQLMTFNTVSERYQETGILNSDCKQPPRIGIIRTLNECTGDFLGPPQGTTTRALI